jgi:hypothetical protein
VLTAAPERGEAPIWHIDVCRTLRHHLPFKTVRFNLRHCAAEEPPRSSGLVVASQYQLSAYFADKPVNATNLSDPIDDEIDDPPMACSQSNGGNLVAVLAHGDVVSSRWVRWDMSACRSSWAVVAPEREQPHMAPASHIRADGLAGLIDPRGQAARDELRGSREANRAAAITATGRSSMRSLIRSPLSCALSW